MHKLELQAQKSKKHEVRNLLVLCYIFDAFYRLGQPHLLELSQKACSLPQVSLFLQEGVAAKAVFKLERSFEPASKRAEKEMREARPRDTLPGPVPLLRCHCHTITFCVIWVVCVSGRWGTVARHGPNIKMALKLMYDKFAGQEAGGAQRVWGGMRAWRLEVPVRFPFCLMASTSPFCLVERAC